MDDRYAILLNRFGNANPALPSNYKTSYDSAKIFRSDDSHGFSYLLSIRNYEFVIINTEKSPEAISQDMNSVRNSINKKTPIIFALPQRERLIKHFPNRKEVIQNILKARKTEDHLSGKTTADIVMTTAATLAHEINNPLMSISANAEILLQKYGHIPEELLGKVRSISEAAARIQEVMDRLTQLEDVEFKDTASGAMINLHPERNRLIEPKPESVTTGE